MRPKLQGRRELAGFGEGNADVGEEIVGEDKEEGEDDAGAFAAALGREAEGYADEHENDASEGIGESDVEFYARGAGVGSTWRVSALYEFVEGERVQGSVDARDVGIVLRI